ncbi:MAG: N-acetylmuramoyl-L-alanine amidase [Bacteroidota bacterium]
MIGKKWLVGSVMLFCFLEIALSQPNYRHLEAYPKKGQGSMALLRSFGINTKCNLSYFYQLNQLNKKSGLSISKSYKLPLLVYVYNNQSIRTTLGITDRPLAERIQEFNIKMHREGVKEADYRDNRILWVPYHYLNCPDQQADYQAVENTSGGSWATQPTTGKQPLRGIYDIFGPEHARVPRLSNELEGCVFYIVSGHGGPDPGAVGRYGKTSLCEDEYAYDIALRLTKNLLSFGATAYLIIRDLDDGIRSGEILPCDKDEVCWGGDELPVNQKERLFQRSNAINELYEKNKKQGVRFQRCISIHVDSDSKRKSTDMYFYHQQANASSLRLAQVMQRTIKGKYEKYRKGRGYSGTVNSRDLHMLREVIPTTLFIELGNIRNRNDQSRLVIEGNRMLISNWLADGLLAEKELVSN